MEKNMKQLSELQIDALREICNIAANTAASALSEILNKRISMKVPQLKIVPIEQVSTLMGDPKTLVAGVYAKIIGEFDGGLLMTFPRNDAIMLVDKLLGHKEASHTLSELDVSAVQEIGNIISGAFVSAIARIIDKTLLISVPRVSFDMLGAIVDFILIELTENTEQALILEIAFEDVPKTVSGHFFILPDSGSMELLVESIKI
jgi:chemotaxis protein CheC